MMFMVPCSTVLISQTVCVRRDSLYARLSSLLPFGLATRSLELVMRLYAYEGGLADGSPLKWDERVCWVPDGDTSRPPGLLYYL